MGEQRFISEFSRLVEIADSWLAGAGFLASRTVLKDAAAYSLLSPGKRFRPVLVLSSAEALGLRVEQVRDFALAVECVHAFSLIHDDLPCMDNDMFRRGQPTCHRQFGEATALLAGDMLLAEAFSLIGRAENPFVSTAWVKLLSGTVVELCDGQMIDLEAAGRGSLAQICKDYNMLSDREKLELRHHKKTGALIRASVCGPAFLLDEKRQEAVLPGLRSFSLNLGLLFQVADDILEATSSSEALGKDNDSDARHGTPTYVSVYGLARAKDLAKEIAQRACQALEGVDAETSFLKWLCSYSLLRER